MIDPQHMNEGMENLKQIEEFENQISRFDLKVMSAIKELREILKTHYYDVKGTKQPLTRETISNLLGSKVATKLENLLGSLLKK